MLVMRKIVHEHVQVDLLEDGLQVTVQALLDGGAHVARRLVSRGPRDSGEIVPLLARHGVLTRDGPSACRASPPASTTSGASDPVYDAEADTLYVSFGSPQPAVGIDIGEGVIVRYDEEVGRVVGVTIVGFADRLKDFVAPRQSRGSAT
jgi:uncharacterized protein YuzE